MDQRVTDNKERTFFRSAFWPSPVRPLHRLLKTGAGLNGNLLKDLFSEVDKVLQK
jgi:hypothetical protein